jgi:hypothetical protein
MTDMIQLRIGNYIEKLYKWFLYFHKIVFEFFVPPTVCVTCAGVGTAKPSSQKNEKK